MTSINAWRKISSDSERINESRAPAFAIPMVIAFSSRPKICALALRSDHVRRRRFFTFSITSGHMRRSAATSSASTGAAALFFTSSTTAFTSTFSSTIDLTAGAGGSGAAFGSVAGEGVAIPCTRSSLSRRASRPESVVSPIGNNMRPQISSRINRGAVAPRICVRPSAAISAARESVAAPRFFACATIRSS